MLFSACFAKEMTIDAIKAIVNDEVITKSDVDTTINQEMALRPGSSYKMSFDKVLNLLVEESVLVQQAKLMGVNVSDTEAQKMLEVFIENNKQTLDSFEKVLSGQGQTLAQFKDKIKRQILSARVQAALMTSKEKPSLSDINAFLEAHKFDKLMLSFDDRLFKSLPLPKNWHKSKPMKFSLTYVKALPSSYQAAITKKPFAKTYGPIKTENGYHMVEVDKWYGDIMSKDFVANYLMMQAIEKSRTSIVNKLKKNFYIKVY